MSSLPYDIIIGLEVHVQLLTRSKLFCRCSTRFGAPPNTQTCPVCTGMPGSLPVMNRQAFELSLKTAVALNCEIPEFTKWDRKQYYYPDLPKNYQISQFDLPLSREGWLEISDPKGAFEPKRVGIIRAHLEEDAGKSMHDEVAGKADSRIDLNRTGTPLLEIVSHPDMRSPQEARAYLDELKLLLTYIGVSDCNMQEGSLRVDANINLHIHSAPVKIATPIVEVKNMNSFRAVERALAYEAARQYDIWQETGRTLGGPGGHKTTRGWDDQAQVTRPQRQKEESSDYRYFPDPDLAPVIVKPEQVEGVRSGLGELPAAIRQRLQDTYGIEAYDAQVIVNQGRQLVDYFVALAQATGDGKRASNWVQQDVLRTLNERSIGIDGFPISAAALADLLRAVQRGDLDSSRARDVFNQMLASGQSAGDAMQSLGIASVDRDEIVALCRRLVADNPQAVAEVKTGKQKALGALIGQAKRQNPNVNPALVREICLQLIETM
jgi:aspartyl-tRNA(Asn)/glutamyl-tRNA(Gln) amidotransferase subunit B